MSHPRVPRDGRWSCCSSGFCCTLYVLGPVEPEIIAGLERLDIARDWAPAAEAPWYEVREGPTGPAAFLRKKDGACVFLNAEKRCAIHALHGAAAKPGFCREFPFQVIEDPAGTVVVARPDCAGFHRSSQTGTLILDQVQEVLDLPRAYAVKRWNPADVAVLPEQRLPIDQWMGLEPALLEALYGMDAEPGALIATLRARVAAIAGGRNPPGDPHRASLAARAVTNALVMVMGHVVREEQAPDASEAAFAAEILSVLERALVALEEPLPALEADARQHLNLLLRSHLLGKQFASQGSVAAGLGLFLLNARIATATAPRTPRGTVSADGLASVLPRLVRLTLNQSIHHILSRARPALVDLYLQAS